MKKRRKPIKRLNDAMKRRTMIACGIIALLFVLLIGRLIYFSIFKNGIYKRQVLSQQNYSSETLPYKRGDILDRDGNTLEDVYIGFRTKEYFKIRRGTEINH